jgi:hypothetical protein
MGLFLQTHSSTTPCRKCAEEDASARDNPYPPPFASRPSPPPTAHYHPLVHTGAAPLRPRTAHLRGTSSLIPPSWRRQSSHDKRHRTNPMHPDSHHHTDDGNGSGWYSTHGALDGPRLGRSPCTWKRSLSILTATTFQARRNLSKHELSLPRIRTPHLRFHAGRWMLPFS